MAHMCICAVCNKKFDRDKIKCTKYNGRRYAHYDCFPSGELVYDPSPEEQELQELEDYIKNLLKEQYNPARVNKQIKEFKTKYNYTYSGMLKTLIWFFEIKKNSIEKANGGIGIIPYVYQDALNYYYYLYLAQVANKDKDISKYQPKIKEIIIQSPRTVLKPKKLFNLDDDEEENNNV